MSKKFKSHASSARAASSATTAGFGATPLAFGTSFQTAPSSLSYVSEFPDLSGVSDPNVVVSLRNLGKKDSVTKAKALAELQEHFSSQSTTIEPALLDIWVGLYPRTSIDNSRRVRQLAHVLQGTITTCSGKRIAPSLPKVVGPWLAGAYDPDKGVARAAQESIAASFATDEKRRALWRLYMGPLARYAEDAILLQTAHTLSDERSTSSDDAESKFVRVVVSAMHMLAQAIKLNLEHTSGTEDPGSADELRRLVTDQRLWAYAYHKDPTLRRGSYSLVLACTKFFVADVDWAVISASFVGKALALPQLGSSTHLSEALLALTDVRPQIWTTDYSGKTRPFRRLSQYLRSGSQRGSAAYWSNIALLLKRIPIEVWTSDSERGRINLQDTVSLLESFRTGIRQVDEPRHNLETAWSAYIDVASWLVNLLLDTEQKDLLVKDSLLSIVVQYVTADARTATWAVPAPIALKLSTLVLSRLFELQLIAIFDTTWTFIAQSLADSVKISSPESSAEFRESQDSVIAQSQRFLRLRSIVTRTDRLSEHLHAQVMDAIRRADHLLVNSAVAVLKARNGRPYSAAALLESLTTDSEASHTTVVTAFLTENVLSLLSSASAEYLVAILIQSQIGLDGAIPALIAMELSTYSAKAWVRILRSKFSKKFLENEAVAGYINRQFSQHLDDEFVQRIASTVLQNPDLRDSHVPSQCYLHLLGCLSIDAQPATQHMALNFLSTLLTAPATPLPTMSVDTGKSLLMKMLILSDSQDPAIADLANLLTARLKHLPGGSGSINTGSSAQLVAEQLSGQGSPLSIFALIGLAQDALAHRSTNSPSYEASLFPSREQWSAAIEPHVSEVRDWSLAITSPLQGAVFAIDRPPAKSLTVSRDADDFSLLFRLTLYVTKLLAGPQTLDRLSEGEQEVLFHSLPLALQLINEKLTLDSANQIWLNTTTEVTDEAADTLSQGNMLLQRWAEDEALLRMWIDEMSSPTDASSDSYIHALAFTEVISRFIDGHGPTSILAAFSKDVAEAPRSPDLIRCASILAATHEYLLGSQPGQKLFNELTSACTELKSSQDHALVLRRLVLMNVLISGNADAFEAVPNQRVVFLMQTLVRLVTDATLSFPCRVEVMRLLDPVLLSTSGIYGDQWDEVLLQLVDTWHGKLLLEDDLPLLHASIRLFARLRTLTALEDTNEDLLDAWKIRLSSLEDGLKQCLASFRQPPSGVDQPRRITSELLRRQLAHISTSYDPNLYPLLSSTEDAVRGAAYDLLHRSIPQVQEEIALELALEHTHVQLPLDLLELLMDPPTLSAEHSLSSSQSFLLSWHLVFDHFTAASYKLREAYSADIKGRDVLPYLLDYICDVCHIMSGRPLDASKLDIRSFKSGASETSQKEEQWLVVHLYYCCLLYLPGLTRKWFIEQKNRVKSPLEAWTQKYFSSALTSTAILTVTEWVANQAQDDSDAPIVVKSSMNGSETVASIAIDPESPPISLAISLPSSYPLEAPTVTSRTRVGVSEKNWQSWLRTFQIIIFSTGSMIEGLVAFRRNVQGALKGQSECAICYSIIGTDMQTPNKRCGTCRNTFHSVCLFRWFKSSNSSSCPLCRNNFNYA